MTFGEEGYGWTEDPDLLRTALSSTHPPCTSIFGFFMRKAQAVSERFEGSNDFAIWCSLSASREVSTGNPHCVAVFGVRGGLNSTLFIMALDILAHFYHVPQSNERLVRWSCEARKKSSSSSDMDKRRVCSRCAFLPTLDTLVMDDEGTQQLNMNKIS